MFEFSELNLKFSYSSKQLNNRNILNMRKYEFQEKEGHQKV